MSTVTLKIGAEVFGGWKSQDINTGIEQLAGSFEFTCADRWALQGLALPILPGQACSVEIDGTPVITGFIDACNPEYGKDDHSLRISGRDATGDLVDSAAQVDGQGWRGRTLEQIAKDLCKPFGIKVVVDANIGKAYRSSIFAKKHKGGNPFGGFRNPFACQQINPGETVFEVLSRAAKLRSALLISDGLGNLLITTTGSANAVRSLVLGEDILEAKTTNSFAERFHTYKVYGQANELFNENPMQAQQLLGTAIDPEIRNGRVTVIDPTDQIDAATAKQLAVWTKQNRIARAVRSEITVRGWKDGAKPWRHNTLVRVKDKFSRLDGDYLIACVNFKLDDRGGELTKLTVTPPAAYIPQPAKEGSGFEGFA
jgi:prophage tail gpP-like protein